MKRNLSAASVILAITALVSPVMAQVHPAAEKAATDIPAQEQAGHASAQGRHHHARGAKPAHDSGMAYVALGSSYAAGLGIGDAVHRDSGRGVFAEDFSEPGKLGVPLAARNALESAAPGIGVLHL